jgi:hypothetical protein
MRKSIQQGDAVAHQKETNKTEMIDPNLEPQYSINNFDKLEYIGGI